MSRRALVLALLLTAPALAGCLAEDAAPEAAEGAPARDAAAAGAVAGPAPAAAKDAYVVDSRNEAAFTAHPVPFPTNAPKPPYEETFEGEFAPQQCTPVGGGLPLGGFGLADSTVMHDVAEAFAQGDVFSYDLTLTFTNTDSSWAELHLWYQFGAAGGYWSEPTSDGRGDVVLNFTGQGYIHEEEFFAAVGVDCWYGSITSPVPYAITLRLAFAEGAVPAEQPVLLRIPTGATRLLVAPLGLDETRPVTSHYRLFAPDDSLVCECALSSDETLDVLMLDAPGEYVLLVDHTEGGFVSLALDAPPESPLEPLGTGFAEYPLVASDGGAVDETLQVEMPSTPLAMWAWTMPAGEWGGPPDAGAGKDVRIHVANARGDVLRIAMAGYVTMRASVPGAFGMMQWYGLPVEGDWEFFIDHHAYDVGAHTVHVGAAEMRGEARLFALHYERP